MATFNIKDKRGAATGPLQTVSAQPTGVTHEGGTGYGRTPMSELFLAATTMKVGEDAFYKSADQVADRMRTLVRDLAVTDEGWTFVKDFLPWLRNDGNVRTAGILLAAEAVHARLAAKLNGGGNKDLIAAVLQRADEPAEMIAYWSSRWGVPRGDGTVQIRLPKPVKRGIEMAVQRLYTQRNFLRYDSTARGVRMGDVLDLTHPSPTSEEQGTLFQWMITARHGRDAEPPIALREVRARWELSRLPSQERHTFAFVAQTGTMGAARRQLDLAMAGQWEWLLPWLGDVKGVDGALSKKQQWELVIPNLGYMALIRNLRNFDEAGIDDETAAKLAARIADPAQVARSRQYPYRFYSAYENAPSLRWGHALDQALTHSLGNIPVLPGRTLVLIDTSASMESKMSGKSTMSLVTAAAIFGLAWKLKNVANVDVYGFADGQFVVDSVKPGASLLKSVEIFTDLIGRVGHGTHIEHAVRSTYKNHDRVIILTDMQTFPTGTRSMYSYGYGTGDVSSAVPARIPVYAFNVAGYSNTAMPVVPGNNRYELGGLTDRMFELPKLLESGVRGVWPWQLSK